jgi:hypothetical protein
MANFTFPRFRLTLFPAGFILAIGCASSPPPQSTTPPETSKSRTGTVESFSCSTGEQGVVLTCEVAWSDAEFRLGCRAAEGANAFALDVDDHQVDLWRQGSGALPSRRYRFKHPDAFSPARLRELLHPPAGGTVLKEKDFWLQTYPLAVNGPTRLRLFINGPQNRWSCTPAGAPQQGVTLPPIAWLDKPVAGGAKELQADLDEILQRAPH